MFLYRLFSFLLFFIALSSCNLHGNRKKTHMVSKKTRTKERVRKNKRIPAKKNLSTKRTGIKTGTKSKKNTIKSPPKKQNFYESVDDDLAYWKQEDLEDAGEIRESREKVEKYLKTLPSERPKPLSKEEAFEEKPAAVTLKEPEDIEFWKNFDKENNVPEHIPYDN